MAIRVDPVKDDRVQRILDNPSDYFAEVRDRIREQVDAEIAREDAPH